MKYVYVLDHKNIYGVYTSLTPPELMDEFWIDTVLYDDAFDFEIACQLAYTLIEELQLSGEEVYSEPILHFD